MKTRTRSACQEYRRRKVRCKGNTSSCIPYVRRKGVPKYKFTKHYLPYDHYALIYLDKEDKLHVDEHSTRERNSNFSTEDMRRKFLETRGVNSVEPISRIYCISCWKINRRLKLKWLDPLDELLEAAKRRKVDERGSFTFNDSLPNQILGTETSESSN